MSKINGLPPTIGIKDPQMRLWAEAMSSAWDVRNGARPSADGDRFVRMDEIGGLAGRAVARILTGAAGMHPPRPGDPTQEYEDVVRAVQNIVTSHPLYELLRTPISMIEAPRQKLQELLDRVTTETKERISSVQAEAATRAQALLDEAAARAGGDQSLQTQINTIVAAGSSDTATILAALQDEQIARVDGDTAEATSRQTLAVQMRGDYAGTDLNQLTTGLLYSERQARISADGVIVTSVTALNARMGTAEAAITSEQTARVNADSALSTSLSGLTARMNTAEAAIVSEQTARSTADAAFTSSLTALTSRVTTAEAAIVSEQTTRANADSAFTSSLTALTSRVSTAEASILTEQTTRSNKDNSLAQALNTIWASIGGSQALIQDGALAAVSPAAVQATKWQQVQAAVTDPNTGQVSTTAIKEDLRAYASLVDGSLNATWSVRANVNGVISGIGLMTTTGAGSAPGTATSQVMIMADRLSLVSPANNALKPVPFSVDSLGNAVFTGTVFAANGVFGGSLNAATGTFSGSLTAQAVNAVDTVNIAGEAVSIVGTASVYSSQTDITRDTLVYGFYMPKAGTASLMIVARAHGGFPSNARVDWWVHCSNGASAGSEANPWYFTGALAGASFVIPLQLNLGVGTWYVYVEAKSSGVTTNPQGSRGFNVEIMNIRRFR